MAAILVKGRYAAPVVSFQYKGRAVRAKEVSSMVGMSDAACTIKGQQVAGDTVLRMEWVSDTLLGIDSAIGRAVCRFISDGGLF